MQENFSLFKFSKYEILLVVHYMKIFLAQLTPDDLVEYRLLKSIFLISMTLAHKLNSDITIRDDILASHFKIKNLSFLEKTFLELVDYRLIVKKSDLDFYSKYLY